MANAGTGSEELLYTIEDGIGHIVLNRPKARNALTFDMYDRLAEICSTVPTDGSLRVLIISGAGGKAFAAGTDISLFRDFDGATDGRGYEAKMTKRLGAIESCPLPIIAAISGACTGGGAAIAACCDLRIGTADMRFGFPIAKTLGNCLSAASLAKLVSLLGHAKVVEMIFTARLIDSHEALRLSLISEILPTHEAVVARALELAREMAACAPLTMRVTKELLRRVRNDGAAANDQDQLDLVYGSADFREGLSSFLAKRPPQWQGR
jgi:enoyl-CoA hydratase/carnithine racemase